MSNLTGLEQKIVEMAARIRELREIEGLSVSYMANAAGVSTEEYLDCEAGKHDLNFAFIYRCAQALRVDVTEIIEGSAPKLQTYTLTRRGAGQKIEQAHGMNYYNMAYTFKSRIAEPLFVRATYSAEAENAPIAVTSHQGQECDIVIDGRLKVQIGDHVEILSAGDTIYYDSSIPHGMVAVGGKDCTFYAIVLDPDAAEQIKAVEVGAAPKLTVRDDQKRVWQSFVDVTENADGILQSLSFKNTDHFNFAYDIIDTLGREKPDKLAMLHIAGDMTERRFSFGDIKRASSQCANYFKSLGIKRGDRVMLICKRHYQFWFSMLALHKIGAVAIPASNQLQEHDLSYRFGAAGISAIICTADGDVARQVELAEQGCPSLTAKILIGGQREGWRNFDAEYSLFSGKWERDENSPGGNDLMLMFFTSGTTGYPKIAAHSYKYALGHFHTAKYWHCVDPEGLHLTISDTGWAKAMWGKMYGQWLCEGATFVYDFDRFDASVILPMFAKYNITTFCAPPTMYRMMIKQDLTKYDLSSVKHAAIAGEALNPEVYHRFKELTGLSLMEGFGQSETTLVIGNLAGMTPKIGSMGKPVPLYDVSIVDPDGNPVDVGESGEIVIRTDIEHPNGLFQGYYNAPEKTAEVWHDGYYHTGDVAWRDEDGYYWYVGRVDDVIKSSGYRIGPFEIESVIMELPYVLECGVSAAPDEIRGQVVKASIVLTGGKQPSEELKKEIQQYVKSRTAPYKYPRIVVFCESLPKTTSGKIIRNKL